MRMENVTPLAGVWIEMIHTQNAKEINYVTPLAGVWIEILLKKDMCSGREVTPLAGVWIEINLEMQVVKWTDRHSPCGSVD